MKKLLKLLIYFHVMIALIVLLLPKHNLYYAFEELLQKEKVYLSNETIIDRGLSLDIQNPEFVFDKLNLAKAENVKVFSWGFINGVRFENIYINEGFSDFLPLEIDQIQIIHFLHNPMVLDIKGESSEGFFFGNIDFIQRKLFLHIRLETVAQKKYPSILSYLNSEEGGYYYEYQF